MKKIGQIIQTLKFLTSHKKSLIKLAISSFTSFQNQIKNTEFLNEFQ